MQNNILLKSYFFLFAFLSHPALKKSVVKERCTSAVGVMIVFSIVRTRTRTRTRTHTHTHCLLSPIMNGNLTLLYCRWHVYYVCLERPTDRLISNLCSYELWSIRCGMYERAFFGLCWCLIEEEFQLFTATQLTLFSPYSYYYDLYCCFNMYTDRQAGRQTHSLLTN